MKIGIFDSGLGGLYLLRSILSTKLSSYDYVFLGDNKNLPYGEKNQKQIYKLTSKAVEFLFKQHCNLVIVACNTSSAQALRKIQREFLPKFYPDRKVLGVIRPTVEVIKSGNVCVLATTSTVKAHAYTKELKKLNRKLKVTEIAAPELVTLIESGENVKLNIAIGKYVQQIKKLDVKSLILGCTHYALIRDKFEAKLKGVKILSQDEFIAKKLIDYLNRHSEVKNGLSKKSQRIFFVTKLNKEFLTNAKLWFGKTVKLNLAKY